MTSGNKQWNYQKISRKMKESNEVLETRTDE